MAGMFSYCDEITSIDVSHFITTYVVNMSEMFEYCASLTALDLSTFKAIPHRYSATDAQWIFCQIVSKLHRNTDVFQGVLVQDDASVTLDPCSHSTFSDVKN